MDQSIVNIDKTTLKIFYLKNNTCNFGESLHIFATMKQQTAVEWLLNVIEPSLTAEQKIFLSKVFEKAKEMEKEHIIDVYINGMYKGQEIYFGEDKIRLDVNALYYSIEISEQYYKETFEQ